MTYEAKRVRIGGEDKNVLIVTAEHPVTREEIGDIGAVVTGYCAAYKRDGLVDTWFFYSDDQDLLIKTWIAERTLRERLANLEDAVLEEEPTTEQERKLLEVGRACTAAIYAGVDVTTSEGAKHFSLEQHDQTELMGLKPSLDTLVAEEVLDVPAIPYHADGELCRLWTAADFGVIFQAAMAHIFYHRTYCNHLNAWIRREEDPGVLAGITYGDDLPADLAEKMLAIIAASEAQA